jgi:hypothetical protein
VEERGEERRGRKRRGRVEGGSDGGSEWERRCT